jgi:hypothetical protein
VRREEETAARRLTTIPLELTMLTIGGKTLGRKKPLFADWSIPLPPALDKGDNGLTLRDLITHIVRAEVTAFSQRQEDRRLVRVLTAADIEKGAARGRIDVGGREIKQDVDPDGAVAAALQAFEDGLYLVVLDGDEQRDLEGQVHVGPDSRVTFVRFTLLAGG